MRSAVFLDRDGVLIENRPSYVRNWAEVAWIPGALNALVRLAATPWAVVLVTNQSCVGRGLLTLEEAESINDKLAWVVRAAGGRIDGIYMCPHEPSAGCDCRKPRSGLLLAAARDLDIDLRSSFMVGDAVTDAVAADGAGVRPILVLTGRGAEQAKKLGGGGPCPDRIVRDVDEAVDYVLSRDEVFA